MEELEEKDILTPEETIRLASRRERLEAYTHSLVEFQQDWRLAYSMWNEISDQQMYQEKFVLGLNHVSLDILMNDYEVFHPETRRELKSKIKFVNKIWSEFHNDIESGKRAAIMQKSKGGGKKF